MKIVPEMNYLMELDPTHAEFVTKCRGWSYCGLGEDCPFDDDCHNYPIWPVYDEALGG